MPTPGTGRPPGASRRALAEVYDLLADDLYDLTLWRCGSAADAVEAGDLRAGPWAKLSPMIPDLSHIIERTQATPAMRQLARAGSTRQTSSG